MYRAHPAVALRNVRLPERDRYSGGSSTPSDNDRRVDGVDAAIAGDYPPESWAARD
jgi:hypothetical protein